MIYFNGNIKEYSLHKNEEKETYSVYFSKQNISLRFLLFEVFCFDYTAIDLFRDKYNFNYEYEFKNKEDIYRIVEDLYESLLINKAG